MESRGPRPAERARRVRVATPNRPEKVGIPGSRVQARAIARFWTPAIGTIRSPSIRPARAASQAARTIPTWCRCGTPAVFSATLFKTGS